MSSPFGLHAPKPIVDKYTPQPSPRQQDIPGALTIKKTGPLGQLHQMGITSTRFGAPPRQALGPNWMPMAVRRLAGSLNKNLAFGLVKTA
jgi:hypothetical protein